ncbi:MAG TPA: hypothetical protein PLT66_02710, partial [Bacillota bacterium]|nr:hypothetical protein [Bacillota bacterium]
MNLSNEKILESVDSCLGWIENQMLSYNRGSVGVYERIRINVNRRICWTRPDCNAEIARVILKRKREDQHDIYENIVNWLLSVSDNDPLSAWYGSFPFYLYNGEYSDLSGQVRFQNDNGKVLIALCDMYSQTKDERLLEAAKHLADYWLSVQRPEGWFFRKDEFRTQGLYKGPCFIFWLAAGIAQLYGLTGDERYHKSVRSSMKYLLDLQLASGRFATTYELLKHEDWRPPSSESSIALFCIARILRSIPDAGYRIALDKVGAYVLSLCHESGGVINSDSESLNASLQDNPILCDLVYTEGFALMGLVEAYTLTGDESYRTAAINLASFLINIQCRNENPLWDGAWRGMYNPVKCCWEGTADQNNE